MSEHSLPQPGSVAEVNDWLALLAEAAREIHPDRSEALEQTAASITSTALTLIPGATSAAITVVDRRHRTIQTLAATDDTPAALNRIQQQAQAGPCLTVLWDEPLVHAKDFRSDQRWPEYSRAAGELGILGVLSVRLDIPDHTRAFGALSLYSSRPGGFHDDVTAIAVAYATHAALALDKATLSQALVNRDLIGQAKGILIERHRLTADAAFELLVQTSQHTNHPLIDVADHLVATGELPSTTTTHD